MLDPTFKQLTFLRVVNKDLMPNLREPCQNALKSVKSMTHKKDLFNFLFLFTEGLIIENFLARKYSETSSIPPLLTSTHIFDTQLVKPELAEKRYSTNTGYELLPSSRLGFDQ